MEWDVIKYLFGVLISVLFWMLKDYKARIDKEISYLKNETSIIKQDYASKESFNMVLTNLNKQIGAAEKSFHDQLHTLEKNLSDKIDLHLRLIESKLKD